tara:strand:- start:9 stop:317 length:309 start_codon:yes stop_codon:yes gene_type:complete
MFRLHIKTYNSLLLKEFLQQLKNHPKLKDLISYTLLPSKYKYFTIKKSPHVFGRSKEKYYLKTYLSVVNFKFLRKRDLLIIFSILKFSKYKEGLGFKFIFLG